MTKRIFKYLLYSFLFSFLSSVTYMLVRHQKYNEMGFRQSSLLLLVLNIVIFILSLTALLNIKLYIRRNRLTSLLSFITLPFGFLLTILIFIIDFDPPQKRLDVYIFILHSSIIFCLALSFNFFKFRRTIDQEL